MVYRIVHYNKDNPFGWADTLTQHRDLHYYGDQALEQEDGEKLVVVDTLTNTIVAALSYSVKIIKYWDGLLRQWVDVEFLGTAIERVGLGTALLRHLRYLMAEAGVSNIQLDAVNDAVPFYRRFGFTFRSASGFDPSDSAQVMKYDLRRRGPSKSLLLEVMRVIRRVTIQ